MELLKSNPIIDKKYQPLPEHGVTEYFNRAMAFAHTNYNDQLEKVAKTQFRRLSPTSFFEEYVWSVCCIGESPHSASKLFTRVVKELSPFYHSFWDINSFPQEDIKVQLSLVLPDKSKHEAIYRCASILNRGIKLYGWDFYKDNLLDTPEKLSVLPFIGIAGAHQLSRNIGMNVEVISHSRLYDLAARWNFTDTIEMCKSIQKLVPMQLRVIELILWYAVSTFETNVSTA
jgi:hypothetical protein